MTDPNRPDPEVDESDEGKVLDDLDVDQADAAGIEGGARRATSNYNYGDGPVSRK